MLGGAELEEELLAANFLPLQVAQAAPKFIQAVPPNAAFLVLSESDISDMSFVSKNLACTAAICGSNIIILESVRKGIV